LQSPVSPASLASLRSRLAAQATSPIPPAEDPPIDPQGLAEDPATDNRFLAIEHSVAIQSDLLAKISQQLQDVLASRSAEAPRSIHPPPPVPADAPSPRHDGPSIPSYFSSAAQESTNIALRRAPLPNGTPPADSQDILGEVFKEASPSKTLTPDTDGKSSTIPKAQLLLNLSEIDCTDFDQLKYLSFLLHSAREECNQKAASTSNDIKSTNNDALADPTNDPTFCYYLNLYTVLNEAYTFVNNHIINLFGPDGIVHHKISPEMSSLCYLPPGSTITTIEINFRAHLGYVAAARYNLGPSPTPEALAAATLNVLWTVFNPDPDFLKPPKLARVLADIRTAENMQAAINRSRERESSPLKGSGGGTKPKTSKGSGGGAGAEATPRKGTDQETKNLYKLGGNKSVVRLYSPGAVHPSQYEEPGMTCMLCGAPSHRAQTCEQAINDHQHFATESKLCSLLSNGKPGGWPSVVAAFNGLQKASAEGQKNLLFKGK